MIWGLKKDGRKETTFRHRFAIMLLQNILRFLIVQKMMGHRNIKQTLRYIHLVNFESGEYTVRVASSLKECTKLLEAGFEYVTDYQDKKIFRKRK